MPLYDVKCSSCSHEEEILKKMTEDLPPCSKCGGENTVVLNNCNFVLVGKNWSSKDAKEDYRMEKIL